MSQEDYVDGGDFVLRFEKPIMGEYVETLNLVKNSQRIRGMISTMNDSFIMPDGVEIVFEDSGGPSYDPEKRVISVGYDFVSKIHKMVQKNSPSNIAEGQTLDILEYVLCFEMARAFLDLWELPLHAAQWESEKQLSIMIVSWMTMDQNIMASVALFQKFRDETELWDLQSWDAYSLGRERLVSTLQFLSGCDPEAFSDAASIAGLTKRDLAEADQYCQELSTRWGKMIMPYVMD